MLEEHVVNPVTYPPMTWGQSLEWLLAHGYDTVIYPTEMVARCVMPQSACSTQEVLNYHRDHGAEDANLLLEDLTVAPGEARQDLGDLQGRESTQEPDLYVIETGTNGLYRQVAWVYESTVPMEEWHEFQQGAEWYRQPGDEEPAEHPWSHWPHVLLGVRREGPG